MTAQAYSYTTVGPDKKIYIPPYGLNVELDKLLILDSKSLIFETVQLDKNNTLEKYTHGIVVKDKIYWLPYGETRVLVYNTTSKTHKYIDIQFPENYKYCKGKYVMGHVYNDKIYSIPYGENQPLDLLLVVDTTTDRTELVKLNIPNNDNKKWHQSVMRNNVIYSVPRGERLEKPFNFSLEFNCETYSYLLKDMSVFYPEFKNTNMKYTTIAIANDVIYAPPYGYENTFDYLLKNDGIWSSEHTKINTTTRKYFTHVKTKNNKLYFPPAGHHTDWSEFLIINGNTKQYKTIDLGISTETKKYFAGVENSKGFVYFIPRGGCVCDPDANLKLTGDLAELLVIDSSNDSYRTIDISECFTDNTTIEKYNHCCIVDDVIFAFPYGESDSFQTVLIFDTINETVKTLDLNELHIL